MLYIPEGHNVYHRCEDEKL